MNGWPDASRNRRDGVTIPTIWVAVALSVLVHIAALWELWPHLNLLPLTKSEVGDASSPLTVRLTPLPGPAPVPEALLAPQSRPSPDSEARRRRPPKTQRRPPPPVMALNRPAPEVPAPPPVATPAVPPAPVAEDMASFIAARRRARGEPAFDSAPSAPAADDDARSKRIVAANLASQSPTTFGYDPAQGGGMFQIERMGYDDAEFLFFGWNKEIRRKTKQLITVRKGNNSNMRIAVVRKMIAIIREHEQGDFLWESQRLGRDVTLSARARDTAGLEEFLMREFFPDTRPSR
jgi:hypothetical protein